MNKRKRRIVTLIVATLLMFLSLFISILSFIKTIETNIVINKYENTLEMSIFAEIFTLSCIFFSVMFLYIGRMIRIYRGRIYDKLFLSYKIVGVLNMFDIIPDFVHVILKKNGRYYGQSDLYEETGKAGILRKVYPLKKELIPKIIPLNNFNSNLYFSTIMIGDKAIEAFQYDDDKIAIGTRNVIREFLLDYKTDDENLKEEINQYLSEKV